MQETINLEELSVEQLESLGFRLMKQLNNVQQNLSLVEHELEKRGIESAKAVKSESKVATK